MMNCFVGYGFNNQTLIGGTVTCGGSCLRATGKVGNNIDLTILACEPLGICDLMGSSVPGFNVDCCDSHDNCNARGHVMPTTAPTLVPPTPILCYEGVYYNSFPLMNKEEPTVCYGDCSSITLSMSAEDAFTVYTCDPAALCASIGLSNSCHQIANGTFAGCCCDSNMCLDPMNNVTVPVGPPPNSTTTETCFIGFNFNNGPLTGGETTCPGLES